MPLERAGEMAGSKFENGKDSQEAMAKIVRPMSGLQTERTPWWRGLRFLVIVWTTLPLTLLLILSVGAATVALQATVKVLAEQHNQAQASLAADQFSIKLEKYRQAFRVLADQPELATLEPEGAAAVFQKYDYLLTDFVADGGLILLDAAGQVVVSYPSQPGLVGQNYSRQPYFFNRTVTNPNLPTFFDIVTEPGTGRDMIGLSIPLVNENGDFLGLLVGRFYLDMQQFGQFIRLVETNTGGQAYLVDHNGRVIFHPDSALIGQDFSQRQAVVNLHSSNQAGAYTRQLPDFSREIIGYAPIQQTGWGLVIAVPWVQVTQPVLVGASFVTSVLVLGLVGLILVALWVAERINQPLRLLVEQTQRVAAGMYDSQVSLSRISEVQALGMAFNHMVRQLETYRRGLQGYVAAVTDSQEEERKRIARDLHDGTIQSLIAIGQRIELARESLEEQTPAQTRQQLTDIRKMVTDTIASVRQFSRDLRPLALEDLGLVPALQFLVNDLGQAGGMSAQLEIEGDATGLSPDLETTIYRIVQEALNNIRKHAQASEVLVTVRFLSRQTILEVKDNGVGFVVPQSSSDLARDGSFGLLGMEERASLFGGDISLYSALNQGTIIRVILPHKQLPRRLDVRAEAEEVQGSYDD